MNDHITPEGQGSADSPFANATTWKPGQSGNPAGGPRKDEMITPVLREYLELPLADIKALRPARLKAKEVVARTLILDAAKAGPKYGRARRDLMERVDGKPRQPVEVLGMGNELWDELGAEWDEAAQDGVDLLAPEIRTLFDGLSEEGQQELTNDD